MVRRLRAGASVLTAIMLSSMVPAHASDDPIISGQEEYLWNCAACHGEQGTGDGPLAPALISSPPDLTRIAERNGGPFPSDAVYETIAGREDVMGHQGLQMPRYWSRFKQSEAEPGFDPAGVRITAIVRYLESIQQR